MPTFMTVPGEVTVVRAIGWDEEDGDAIVLKCSKGGGRSPVMCQACTSFRGNLNDGHDPVLELQKPVGVNRWDRVTAIRCALTKRQLGSVASKRGPIQKKRDRAASKKAAAAKKKPSSEEK